MHTVLKHLLRSWLAFGTLSLAAAAAPAAERCLRIEAGDANTPVIQATVDGSGPFPFILDTASSGTTIDPDLAERLRLSRDTATETAQGMGGDVSVRLYRAGSVHAGPLSLSDATLPSFAPPQLSSHQVVGLAGTDLFGSTMAVWRPGARCVMIAPSGSRPSGKQWRQAQVNWIRPWKVMLPIRIGRVEGWAMLDTGAQFTTINPRFAQLLQLGEAQLEPAGSITGIDGRDLPLSSAPISDVAVGWWRWDTASVHVGALPVFDRLGPADSPLAILGMDWLAARGFAVDYGARTVWLLKDRR